MLKIKSMIITKDNKYFIHTDVYSFAQTGAGGLVNGESPKPTHKPGWFEINGEPKTIEIRKSIPGKNVYVLDKSSSLYQMLTEETKNSLEDQYDVDKVLDYEEYDGDLNDPDSFHPWFLKIKALYNYVAGYSTVVSAETPFEIEEVLNLSCSAKTITSNEDSKGILKYVIHNTVDEIEMPALALATRPCSISSKNLYKIVRESIKQSINSNYAVITSDYDFCFSVSKKLNLAEPFMQKVDVSRLGAKKPKYENKLITERKVPVFSMTHAEKKYGEYPILEGITGRDHEDLVYRVNAYINDLLTKINAPMVECPHCKGTGAIIESEIKSVTKE